MELTINGDTTATTTTTSFSSSLSSEIIRQQSIQQYEQAMEYFMFELGNDIVFLSNNNDVSTYMNHNFDTIIFDCEGVLYGGGNVPIPECKDAIKYLMLEQKKHILFLTNNGEYSREGLCEKLMLILNGEGEQDEEKEKEEGEGISEKLELSQEQMITSIDTGKSSNALVDLLQKEYQLDMKRTLMVGDRLDTDVKFGKDSGMKSALVLTGCTTAEKLMEVGVGTEDEPLPHIIFPHIGMMAGN